MNESIPDCEEDTVRPAPSPPRVVYITAPEQRSYADLLPSNQGRSSIVHSLIEALDLLDYAENDECTSSPEDGAEKEEHVPKLNKARVFEPFPATRADLCRFHDKAYINALFQAAANLLESRETSFDSDGEIQASPKKRVRLDDYTSQSFAEDLKHESVRAGDDSIDEDHGLEHDCPVFQDLEEYCSYIAGGSITAAKELRQNRADLAIFWDGGRHHATKSAAAGFCYVNDIVLSILELQKNPTPERSFVFSSDPSSQANAKPLKRLKKILYIDLDLHHGDGVAEAFESNANVITVSLHLWSKGFYPSTAKGHLDYTGPLSASPAAGTSLNVAIPKSGLSDTNFNKLVEECIKPIFEAVKPDAVVLQCGVDGLAGDPCKEFNVSLAGYGRAVQSILSWCGHVCSKDHSSKAEEETERSRNKLIPVLMLGGGGYHSTNAARIWAYLTSIGLGNPLDYEGRSVPEHCSHWETFYNDGAAGDGLDVPAHTSRKDENTDEDIQLISDRFEEYAGALAGDDS